MLGLSSKVKRNELLAMKATGTSREFSDWFQENILDRGHEIEELALPLVEAQLGQPLYQMTFSDGLLSASVDGITVDDALAWECKRRNAELWDYVQANSAPPEEHMPQCQQVLMISGAKELMFTVSDGTEESTLSCIVKPDPQWFALIRAGWEQFASDLAAFKPAAATAPPPVANVIDALPALLVNVEGRVLSSNLEAYRAGAERFLAKINTDLVTDQHFADAEKTVKFCKDGEDRLELAKSQALEQTADIKAVFDTLDAVKEQMRAVRLRLDKLVTQRKTERRAEIAAGGHRAMRDHVIGLNERLGQEWLIPAPSAGPFGEAIKGLKTLDSMQNAVDTALANAKIAANEMADRLERNRKSLVVDGVDWFFLFADFATVGAKPAEDFSAIAALRIQAHQAELARAEEAKKAREAAAAEERARAEAARVEREAAAQRQRAEAEARALATVVAAPVVAPPVAVAAPLAQLVPAPSAAPVAAPKQARPPISTGMLCALLGGIYTAEFFTRLGFKAVAPPDGKKTGVWWARADVAMICREMIARLQGVIDVETA